MKKNQFKANYFFLFMLLFFYSCSGNKPVQSEAEEVLPEDIVELRADQIKLAGIEFGQTELQSMGEILRTSGYVSVAPQNKATVSMPMGGFVKTTTLLPGDQVAKGQLLALVENQDFIDIQRDYLEARNKLTFAEAEFKRHTTLYNEDVYSEKNVQQVTVDYRNLEASVNSLGQKLGMIGIDPQKLTETNISSTVKLLAPMSGYLSAVNVNIGKYVSPTDVLFEIINDSKMFLQLSVFEKDAGKIGKGSKINFFINNETEVHHAEVSTITKSVNDDRTLTLFAIITTPCKNIYPGMYVNASVEVSDNQVNCLPSESVVSFDDRDYIFVYSREKEEAGQPFTEYRMVEVKKGLTANGLTEVSPLDSTDLKQSKIVVRGAYNLLSAKKNAGEMAC